MSDQTPPIPTQVSRLAAQDPDAPAVTCSGHTLTRRELDLSTNRLARVPSPITASASATT